jgi:hypothetical protein
MNFNQCLRNAVEQGAVSNDEAEELLKRFEELRGQYGLSMDDATARTRARDDLAGALRAEGIETRRRAKLQEAVRGRVDAELSQYRNARGEADILAASVKLLEHYGFAGFSSVVGRTNVIIGRSMETLGDFLSQFERNFVSGTRKNAPALDEVRRAMHGEPVTNPAAAEMATKVQEVFEALRQRFNAAGGAIGKLQGGYIPHWHDPEALMRAGKPAWKDAITPLIDLGRMRHHLTGKPMTPADLSASLDEIYDRIITDGWNNRLPAASMSGKGMLASQRAEHRFLHFKDADAWQKYADDFGQGDVFTAIIAHIRGMAHDIAAMEILGPNPAATLEYMKQTIKAEKAKATLGKPSLFNAKTPLAAYSAATGDNTLDSVWSVVRGGEVVNSKMAIGFGTVRNVLTSAQLGSAIIPSLATDPVLGSMAKKLAGLPTVNIVSEFINTFRGASRQEAVQAGLILDDALFAIGKEARFAGALSGSGGSRWLADRTITLSYLAGWTQGRKHTFGIAFQQETAAAIAAGKGWDALDMRFRSTLEGFGMRATDWAVMAKATPYTPPGGVPILRPHEIGALDNQVADKYLEAILGFTERAVPSGTKTGRALLTGGQKAGTIPGEVLNGIMQYKSFGLSVAMLQIEAVAQEVARGGRTGGARYAGGLFLGLTLGGALAIQIKHLANGKDPQPMDDARFWLAAAKTGGGLGIYGDFLFAEHGRFGHSITADMLGPQAGLLEDMFKVVGGNIRKAADDESDVAGDAIRLGRRYVPGVSSLWYTRAAWNRVLMDQLQYLADPDAHQTFRQMEKRLDREYEQEFFWRPGQVLPERGPRINADTLMGTR